MSVPNCWRSGCDRGENMSKRRRHRAPPEETVAKTPRGDDWPHREIKMERTGRPPSPSGTGPSFAHISETYYSSAEGEPHHFIAAPSENEAERLVHMEARLFPGAHVEGAPSSCPMERHSSWSHRLEYAPASHGESCQLETTVPDPAAYLVDRLDHLRAEGKEFVVITQLQTIPRRHGRETMYSIAGRVAIDGPAAEEVVEQGIRPWLASFRCTTCARPWFEVDMLELDHGEPVSSHGPDALHRRVLLPADAPDSAPFFKQVRDALLVASSEDEAVGVEVIGTRGSLRLVAFGSERTLREVERLLGSTYPDGSVGLAPEVIPCPYQDFAGDKSAGQIPPSPPTPDLRERKEQGEHMAFGSDYPVLIREVLNFTHEEAERRGFRLITAFLRDEAAMKVYETFSTEVVFDQHPAPIPRPANPMADARAVAMLVRREAAKRGLTVLLLNLEEGDGGTGGDASVHCFGDRELVREYIDRAEKAEGHPVVQVDYTQLYPWPTEEEG